MRALPMFRPAKAFVPRGARMRTCRAARAAAYRPGACAGGSA